MVRITVDDGLEAKLADAKEPVEICTENGRLLGRFIPVGPLFLTVEEARKLGCFPLTDEELAEIQAQPWQGRPLAEILRDLENR